MLPSHGSFCLLRTDDGQCAASQVWKYFLLPALILLADFGGRCWRRYRQPAPLLAAILHPQRVIELHFASNPSIHASYRPGQFVYLMCPGISRLQWHPFTISQCTGEMFSVHIKVCGDWTGELLERLKISQTMEGKSSIMPLMYLDGPYAGPVQDAAVRHDSCVLVAGGIGITPFIPLLQWFSRTPANEMPSNVRLKKLYLVWIAREADSFEWFHPVLKECEREAQRNGRQIELILHWTVKKTPLQVMHNISLNSLEEGDAVTGLQSQTNYGRPRWNSLFKRVIRDLPQEAGISIGVYCCVSSGRQLVGDLQRICRQYRQFHLYPECF
jgi:NADPH oxidase